MGLLLDTCVISDFVKAEQGTMSQLLSRSPSSLFVSTITIHEIYYGLEKNKAVRLKIEKVLIPLLKVLSVVPFDEKSAGIAASIRATLEKKGQPIGLFDSLIAATALAHSLGVVTANVREFSRISDLHSENWRESH